MPASGSEIEARQAGAPAPLDLDGPAGVLRVWLGNSGNPTLLEADVRAATVSCATRPAVAVSLGEVARRHRLEVRIFPRVEDSVSVLFVLFGARTPGYRR